MKHIVRTCAVLSWLVLWTHAALAWAQAPKPERSGPHHESVEQTARVGITDDGGASVALRQTGQPFLDSVLSRIGALPLPARVLVGALAILGLAIMAWSFTAMIRRGRRSRWPYARGKMISGEVVPNERGSKYRIQVRYAFQVDGREYEGSTFGIEERLFDRKEADRQVRRFYHAGNDARVRYHAGDPTRSYLASADVTFESNVPMVLAGLGFTLSFAAIFVVMQM